MQDSRFTGLARGNKKNVNGTRSDERILRKMKRILLIALAMISYNAMAQERIITYGADGTQYEFISDSLASPEPS